MLSFISRPFACLLMVLIPLQAIAAANMAVCNSMMQVAKISEYSSADMPCHKHMDKVLKVTQDQKKSNSKTASESNCAAMCASLNVSSIIPSVVNPTDYLASVSIISMPYQAYASITQANLLRPPIFLS